MFMKHARKQFKLNPEDKKRFDQIKEMQMTRMADGHRIIIQTHKNYCLVELINIIERMENDTPHS